ncbi:MAG: hypothetical protein ABIH49_02265 [archaeon]
MQKTNMKTKNLFGFFLAVASVLLLAANVSASFSNVQVTVDNVDVLDSPSIVAGELVTFKVYFTSTSDATDVKARVEIEGKKTDVTETTSVFDVEGGHRYVKVLTLRVPYELYDEVSEDADLNVKIWGGESTTYENSFAVRVQRPSYNADLMSVSVGQTVNAGEIFPVDVVLKNTGYNKLDDLYVTVKIPELEIKKTAYFGDLVSLENDDNDDTISGRILLQTPFSTKPGVYTLEVEVKNNDMTMNVVKQISIENHFISNVVVSGNELMIVNPTNKLMVLRLVADAPQGVSVVLSDEVVAVPAGSSRTVIVDSNSLGGTKSYSINLFTMDGELVDSVTLSTSQSASAGNAVAVLTVILTIVFLVLLVVLVVLLRKKPEKSSELGESYY